MVQRMKPGQGTLFDDTPRGILEALLVGGGIIVALTTAPVLIAALGGLGYILKADERARRKKLQQYGGYLMRKKYVDIRPMGKGSVRIALTRLGRERALNARSRRILSQQIAKPSVWDKKWRLILFDIAADERGKRNAFRSFVKRIGAVMLQKSVWVHPFDCKEHIALLRDFFALSPDELQLVVADSIEHDEHLRRHFRL